MAKPKKKASTNQGNLFNYLDIKIKPQFARSTNLKKDFEDGKSIDHLIFSDKFQKHFVSLSDSFINENSNQRVHVLSGTPGVGKSTFSVFLAKMLAKKETKKISSIIDQQKKEIGKEFVAAFKEVSSLSKYEPIFLNGDEGKIEQAFFHALEDAFERMDLKKEFADISKEDVSKISSVLKSWQKDYPDKYQELEAYIEENSDEGFDKFAKAVKQGRRWTLPVFEQAYSEITGGASLGQMFHGQIVELFEKAVKLAKKHKKAHGFLVIYDEFGKYLERGVRHPQDFDLQFLQDFAESCNRSGKDAIHLLLITHLPISQYAIQLPTSIQQEWAKIEGRFEQKSFNDGSASGYTVINSVFESDIKSQDLKTFKEIEKISSQWLSAIEKPDIFGGLAETSGVLDILNNCYPLHPSVLALLPLLSEKVAQNERTLFSFLTREEEHSLKWSLKNNPREAGAVDYIRPVELYSYFRPLVANDVGIGGTCKIGIIIDTALNELKEAIDRDVVSIIGISSIVNNRNILKLSEGAIIASLTGLYKESEIKEALETLVKAKHVLFNKAKNEYVLFEGSSIDLREEIIKVRQDKLTAAGYIKVLQHSFPLSYVVPKRYNFQNGITRFYKECLISVEELKKGNLEPDFNMEDGRVYYVAVFDKAQLKMAEELLETVAPSSTIFVVPNKPLEIESELLELHAIEQLYSKKELLSAGVNVKKELAHYKSSAVGAIRNSVQSLKSLRNMDVTAFFGDEFLDNIKELSEISHIASDQCEAEFHWHPKFDNEMLNKAKASTPVIQGRKRLMGAFLEGYGENFDIVGGGPEFSLAKAFLKTNTLEEELVDGKTQITSFTKDSAVAKLFVDYLAYIADGDEPQPIFELIQRWKKPPFGVREPMIPLYMALFHKVAPSPISYYQQGVYVNTIDKDLFENILKQPKRYSANMIMVDKAMQIYLDEVASIFSRQTPKGAKKIEGSNFLDVAKTIYSFFKYVPEYTKLSTELSARQKRLVTALDSFTQPEKFLLEQLPKALLEKSYKKLSSAELKEFFKVLELELELVFEFYPQLISSCAKVLNAGLVDLYRKTSDPKFKEIKKGEPLAVLWKEAWNDLSSATKEYPYQRNTQLFVNRIEQLSSDLHNQITVESLCDILVGAHPKNWNAKGLSLLEVRLKTAISEVVQVHHLLSGENKNIATFSAFGEDGQPFVAEVIKSKVDESTYKKAIAEIQKTLADVGLTEKNDILLRLLRDLNEDSLGSSNVTNKSGIGANWG